MNYDELPKENSIPRNGNLGLKDINWDLMGPPPDPLPLPFTGPSKRYLATLIPIEEVILPEGYFPIIGQKGKTGAPPYDRQMNMRKVREIWWESTWLDGKIVPIKALWRGQLGTLYVKPEGFDTRKLCGAWMGREQRWCALPLDTAMGTCANLHCGKWASRSGRACVCPLAEGRNTCRHHSKKTARGKGNLVLNTSQLDYDFDKLGYFKYMDPVRRGIRAAIISNGPLKLDAEIETMRAFLAELLQESNASASTWKNLQDAWNRLVNSKGQEAYNNNLSELGGIIQSGVDKASAREEASKMAERIGRVVMMNEKVMLDRSQIVTNEQLKNTLGYLLHAMRNRLQKHPVELKLLSEDFRDIIAVQVTDGHAPIPIKHKED